MRGKPHGGQAQVWGDKDRRGTAETRTGLGLSPRSYCPMTTSPYRRRCRAPVTRATFCTRELGHSRCRKGSECPHGPSSAALRGSRAIRPKAEVGPRGRDSPQPLLERPPHTHTRGAQRHPPLQRALFFATGARRTCYGALNGDVLERELSCREDVPFVVGKL
jgi:hypothetical protein